MNSGRKQVAAERHRTRFGEFPLEFVIAEGDLVTVAHHELRTEGADEYDFFGFGTYRFRHAEMVEEWSNGAAGSKPLGSGAVVSGRDGARLGAGTPLVNKPLVSDFYRCVFDAHNPGAVSDFVHDDYIQHSSHLPPGRAGLEALVAGTFPDGPIPTPEEPAMQPSILMGEGDVVVIAAALPQPDGEGGTYMRYLYDAYRVRGGRLCEHWSGVDPGNRPIMG